MAPPQDSTVPGSGPEPPSSFLAGLAAAFRRLRPQGSAAWNFSDAFTRLDREFGTGAPTPAAPPPAVAGPPPAGALRRAADRHVLSRLEAWVNARADQAAREATAEALAGGIGRFENGFSATVDAFRFLSARVERLEGDAVRRRYPVEGVPWLAPAPDLSAWAGPLAAWLGPEGPEGPVVHAECGTGTLCRALAARGVPARGVEPRGALAWEAAAHGVEVQPAAVQEFVASAPAASLAGLVLSGVVDRLGTGDRLDLVDRAGTALAPGAPLVVLGTGPDAVREAWGPVAWDLLPGRPWHPETWELVLERAGFVDVCRLGVPAGGDAAGPGVATVAVAGRMAG